MTPFYLVTRSLDRHLDQVATKTAQQVERVRREAEAGRSDLEGDVHALREDVDRQLSDVFELVRERLGAEAAADEAAFESLRTAPNREAVMNAFERARQLGLASTEHPPRVNIGRSTAMYASVHTHHNVFDGPVPTIRLEARDGTVTDEIEWPNERPVEDVLVDVGRALRRHTGETFDPSGIFSGLADLLEAALSHPERRPAIELCPPQWMVCEWGVITYDRAPYGINHAHLRTSKTIDQHMREKVWLDADSWESAWQTALALFPPNRRDRAC